MKLPITAVILICCPCFLFSQTISPFIHIDQFGYLPYAEKVAVISNPAIGFNAGDTYNAGPQIEVREAPQGNVVMTAAPVPWNNLAIHNQSGDRGWWFDFSSLTAPGTYYLYDPTNNARSGDFLVSDTAYREVLRQAGRMFFYNRCGMAKEYPYADLAWEDRLPAFLGTFQDGSCRYVYDSTNAALTKDLSGGWFDAGDYNKYVTFTFETLHNLLWAYEENPLAFGDDWRIPESGNGIPDLLDEAIWELDWLKKMNNADGSTHIKMGSVSYSDNSFSPPASNTDPRYYGPTCTSASITVASVFAHAARVLQNFPALSAYSNDLASRAATSWNYALPFLSNNTLETACDDGTIKSGDADWTVDQQEENAVAAAAYLFFLTSDSSYHQYFLQHYSSTEPMAQSWIGPYKAGVNNALMHYTTLPNADPLVRQNIFNVIGPTASLNQFDFFGFDSDDLYRAEASDWMYHWGSNQVKAGLGTLNLLINRYNLDPGNEAGRQRRAAEMIHYFHGVNPLNLVQLSNMYDYGGDHCVNQIYHGWFAHFSLWDNALTGPGPAPGYLTGGANATFSVTSLSPPAGQPQQKSYLDFNDDSPFNSWEITEPAIYYQAAYIRLLANYVPGPQVHLNGSPLSREVTLFPNPGAGRVRVMGCEQGDRIEVLDLMGHLVRQQFTNQPTIELNLSEFANGVYLIRVTGAEHGHSQTLRWVKK